MYKAFLKRFFDLLVASASLLLLTPIAILVVIIIKIDSKGPAFFTQKRYGKNRKVFTIYKFRTMYTIAPRECATNDLVDARKLITPFGKLLRLSSIDELPQLVNIIKGDMSLIGPRPVILSEIDLINEREKYGANSCRPGITGWAQVNGRDELRIKEKAKMDGKYVKNLGPKIDMKCLIKTISVIVFAHGHKDITETLMPENIPQQILSEFCGNIETAN